MTVVATAGHVDHGKSALVQALTGIDPDRWPEEKARGLTLDLGFAVTTLPFGPVSFVDVPGHHRYLDNMLVGIGDIDAYLLVVAATEGWKPQSEEHVSILELTGTTSGVVALTKVDVASDRQIERARAQITERLDSTRTGSSPAEIVEVATPAGRGVPELRDALDRVLRSIPAPPDRDRPRLWIDRSFPVAGRGTVVTGTLGGGALAVGETVVIEPGGVRTRIRSLQNHDAPVDRIGPHNRVALNLPHVGRPTVRRGRAVVRPDEWHLSVAFDACCDVLGGLGSRPLGRRGAHTLHVGTGAWQVGIHVIGGQSIGPGERGFVRVRLPEPIPLVPGDRFVLRDAGRGRTVAGGEVVDVAPVRAVSRAQPDRSVERVVREHGWIDAALLRRLTGERVTPNLGPWVVSPEAMAETVEHLVDRVAAAVPMGLDPASLTPHERALLDAGMVEAVEFVHGSVLPSRATEALRAHPWLHELALGGFTPPDAAGVAPAERRALVQRGLVVERDGVYFHVEVLDRAAAIVGTLLADRPHGFTVAEAREAMATTRKFALPILAELDARGITVRDGDRRRAGPNGPVGRATRSFRSPSGGGDRRSARRRW